jgi:hypothetical protein
VKNYRFSLPWLTVLTLATATGDSFAEPQRIL